MKIPKSITISISALAVAGGTALVVGTASPADAGIALARPSIFHGGCCRHNHRIWFSVRNFNPHRELQNVIVSNKFRISNTSTSGSDQKLNDKKLGVSSSAGAAGGGGGGGAGSEGGDAKGAKNAKDAK